MEGDRPCPTCGQLMPFGQSECSERKGTLWSPERESLVLLAFPALVAFFVVTGFAARAYHRADHRPSVLVRAVGRSARRLRFHGRSFRRP